jgi:hypothetical protein
MVHKFDYKFFCYQKLSDFFRKLLFFIIFFLYLYKTYFMINKEERNLIAKYKKKLVAINAHLLDKQKAWDNLESIRKLHIQRLKMIEKMENTDEKDALRKLAKKIEKIDFNLQEAWGFEKSPNFHYWWKVPKCTCPQMDNEDAYGTKYRIIDENCPIHGK